MENFKKSTRLVEKQYTLPMPAFKSAYISMQLTRGIATLRLQSTPFFNQSCRFSFLWHL